MTPLYPVAACLQAGTFEIPVGPLSAGLYSVALNLDGAPLGSTGFRVRATDMPRGASSRAPGCPAAATSSTSPPR